MCVGCGVGWWGWRVGAAWCCARGKFGMRGCGAGAPVRKARLTERQREREHGVNARTTRPHAPRHGGAHAGGQGDNILYWALGGALYRTRKTRGVRCFCKFSIFLGRRLSPAGAGHRNANGRGPCVG